MRVAINGFGRIGRAITRANIDNKSFDLVAINDINPDQHNIAYLLKYDSVFGRLSGSVIAEDGYLVIEKQEKIALHCQTEVDQVPWSDHDVDILIDATGIERNISVLQNLKGTGINHCILTNSPAEKWSIPSVVMGVNENTLNADDFLIASCFCDTNAFVPVVHLLDEAFGVSHGFATTLHPWLNYQNLLDGPALQFSDPGSIHSTYALGRSSINSLIPKTTSCVTAAQQVLPWIKGNFLAMSFRVPTMNVCALDLVIKTKNKISSSQELNSLYEQAEKTQQYHIIGNNNEGLTSVDFIGNDYSAVVDHRWTMLLEEQYCKLLVWYDNESAYSMRVIDLVGHLKNLQENA